MLRRESGGWPFRVIATGAGQTYGTATESGRYGFDRVTSTNAERLRRRVP